MCDHGRWSRRQPALQRASKGRHHDRGTTFQRPWPTQKRLVGVALSFQLRRLCRSDRMGFGKLRVWNDDTINPEPGFQCTVTAIWRSSPMFDGGRSPTRTILGNLGRTSAGDVQVMSAGTGIIHAEYNREASDITMLFQIWIEPAGGILSRVGRRARFPTRFKMGGDRPCLRSIRRPRRAQDSPGRHIVRRDAGRRPVPYP